MNEAVRQEIESLRTMKAKELKLRYRAIFGEDSPSSNHQHLFRRIAWRLQAKAEGGLSEAAKERSYRGKTIVVTVLELGFSYGGQTFASLSAIAHLVTGTRWNGFLFFGLLNRKGE